MTTSPTSQKGARAEQLAASYLERVGYRILERNYRCRMGEIDLIAEEGQVLCFVEVRSLLSAERGHPLETIRARKQQRLLRAVRHYLLARGDQQRELRFDVVAVLYQPELKIELVRGAFESHSAW